MRTTRTATILKAKPKTKLTDSMRSPAMISFAFAASASLSAAARAEVPIDRCADAHVVLDGQPAVQWVAPIARACEILASLPAIDPSARVHVRPAGSDVLVDVVLRDGRSAVRRIEHPERLESTLEALMTIPPEELGRVPDPESTEVPRKLPRPGPDVPVSLQPAALRSAEPPDSAAGNGLGFEFGGGVGARLSEGPSYSVSIAAYAELNVRDWLVGTSARWDPMQTAPPGAANAFEMDTVGTGLFAARRFRPWRGALDVGLSPRVVTESQSYQPGASTSETTEESGSQSDVRIGLFLRSTWSASSIRPFVEIDGEIAPSRLRRDVRLRPALPPLPAWSAGLVVGISLEKS